MKNLLSLLSITSIIVSSTTTVIACGYPENKYFKYEFDLLKYNYYYKDIWMDDYSEIIKLLKNNYPDHTFIMEKDLKNEEYQYSQELQTIFIVKIVNSFPKKEIYVEQFNSDNKIAWNNKYSYSTNVQHLLHIKLDDSEIISDFINQLKEINNEKILYNQLSNEFIDFVYSKNGFDLSGNNFEFVIVDNTGKIINNENEYLNPKEIDILSIEDSIQSNKDSYTFSVTANLKKESSIKYDIKNLNHLLDLKWNENGFWKKDFNGLKTTIISSMEKQMESDLTIENYFDFRKYVLNNPKNISIIFKNENGNYLTEDNYNMEMANSLCENNEIYNATFEIISPIDNYTYWLEGITNITLKFML